MVTRSHLVSLIGLGLLTTALVISAAFVKNPDSRTRIFNLAREVEEDISPAGCKASGGSYDSRTKNCTFTPGQTKKAEEKAKSEEKANKKPKSSAKTRTACEREGSFWTNGHCYAMDEAVPGGYHVCNKSPSSGQSGTYLCPDPPPPPAPGPPPGDGQGGGQTEPPKYCTFKSGSGQYVTIPPGESVAGGASYDLDNDGDNDTAVRVCDPITGDLIHCTVTASNNCLTPTIAPGGSSYKTADGQPLGASCSIGGILYPSGPRAISTASGYQTCTNGQTAKTADPATVGNYLLGKNGPPPEISAACQQNNNGQACNPDQLHAFADSWLGTASPETYGQVQTILAQNQATEDAAAAITQAYHQAIINNDAAALAALKEQGLISPGLYDSGMGLINPQPAVTAPGAATPDQTALKTCEAACGRGKSCALDAAGKAQCVDADIHYDSDSLGTIHPSSGLPAPFPQAAVTACGGSLQACCRAGYGQTVSFSGSNQGECNTGMACGDDGRCLYDIAKAKSTATANVIKTDPQNFQQIIANNAAVDPLSVAKVNETIPQTQGDCDGTLTYSDTAQDFICITNEVLEQTYYNQPQSAAYPDSGNLNQACRWDWGNLNFHACNNEMLTCINNTCQLSDPAKNLLAAGDSQFNLTTINSPGLALSQNVSLAQSGCTADDTTYAQNGGCFRCLNAAAHSIQRMPNQEYCNPNSPLAATLPKIQPAVAPTIKTMGKYNTPQAFCPEGLVLLENLCLDPIAAAFTPGYDQGVTAANIRENPVINALPLVNFVVDHVVAPIFAAIPGSSYYRAAQTQADVAMTMLENSDTPLEQVLSTISPNARVYLHLDTASQMEGTTLYQALGYTSLFTHAWTEGLTGADSNAFYNYAATYADPNATSGEKALSAALFGGEIALTAGDIGGFVLAPFEKSIVAATKNVPFFVSIRAVDQKIGAVIALPLVAFGKAKYPILDLARRITGGAADLTDNLFHKGTVELTEQGLQEVPETAAKKLTAALPDADGKIITVSVPSDAATVRVGDADFLVAHIEGGSTYLINPATGDSFLVDGSSGLLTQLSEATDKFIHDVFPGLAKSYDDQFDAAAAALTKLANGNLDYLNDAAKIRHLTDAGYPPYLIDADLLDELDNALAKTVPNIPPADEMLAKGADPHLLDEGSYVEVSGIQTIKTSDISSINSDLATDFTDQGLTVDDFRQTIRDGEFRWGADPNNPSLPYSNKDPIVAYELADGTYHIQAGRHRTEALVRENVPEIQVRLWKLEQGTALPPAAALPNPPAVAIPTAPITTPNWFQRNIRSTDGTWFPALRRPTAPAISVITPAQRTMATILDAYDNYGSRLQEAIALSKKGKTGMEQSFELLKTLAGEKGWSIQLVDNEAVAVINKGQDALSQLNWENPARIGADGHTLYVLNNPNSPNLPYNIEDIVHDLGAILTGGKIVPQGQVAAFTAEELAAFGLAPEQITRLINPATNTAPSTWIFDDLVTGRVPRNAFSNIPTNALNAPVTTWWQKIKKPVLVAVGFVSGLAALTIATINSQLINFQAAWQNLVTPTPTQQVETVAPKTQQTPTQLPPTETPTETPAIMYNFPDTACDPYVDGGQCIAAYAQLTAEIIADCKANDPNISGWALKSCFCQKIDGGCPPGSAADRISNEIASTTTADAEWAHNQPPTALQCLEYVCAVLDGGAVSSSGHQTSICNCDAANAADLNGEHCLAKTQAEADANPNLIANYAWCPITPSSAGKFEFVAGDVVVYQNIGNDGGHIAICNDGGSTCTVSEANYEKGGCNNQGCTDTSRKITPNPAEMQGVWRRSATVYPGCEYTKR